MNYFSRAIRGQALLSQARLRAETDKIGFTTSYSKVSIDRDEIAFVDNTRFQTGKGKKELEILYRNSWAVYKALNVRANILSSRGLKVICKTDKTKKVLKEMLFRMHPSRPMEMLQESFRLRSLNADIFGNAFDELLFTPTGTKEKPKSVSEATDMLGFSVMHPMNTDFIRENFDSLITMEGNKPKGYVWRQDPLQESDKGVELEIPRVGHLKYNVIGDELLGMSSIEPMFKTAERLLKIEEGVTQGILTHGNPLHDVIVGDEAHPPTKNMIDEIATAVQGLNTKSEYVHPPWIRVGQIESFSLGKSPNYMQPFITAIAACTSVPEFILLGRGEGCYSSDTQTLTEEGWKFYWEIKDKDKIATYNPDTSKLEYHKPKGFSLYKHTGKMLHFKNSVTDIMVTPDHKMFVSSQSEGKNSNNWKLTEAQDIKFSRFHFKNNLKWDGINKESIDIPEVKYDPQSRIDNEGNIKIPSDVFMEFLGYYISEGSHSGHTKKTYKIEVWQNAGEKHDKMKVCFEKLPFSVNFEKDRFRFASKSLYYWLDQFGSCSLNKSIPKWIKELNPKLLQILLDALILGDGTRHSQFNENSTTICYYTSSRQLADDVSEIMLKTNHVVNIRKYPQEDKADKYRVFGNKSWKDSKFLKEDIEEIDYDDMVYCYQVPNHLFVTKRNGKIAIQGNTNKATAQSMINFIHQAILPLQNAQALYFEEQILAPLMKLNKIEEIPKVEWNEILPRDPNDYANIIKVFSELIRDEKPVVSGEELREMGGLTNETSFKTEGTSVEMAKGSEKEPIKTEAYLEKNKRK